MTLADRLGAERTRILESWRVRASTDVPPHMCSLGPGIAAVVETIVDSLQSRARDPSAGAPGAPVLLGRTSAISVERSVLEMSLLRQTVFLILEEAGPLRAEERDLILDALDASTASVASHGRESRFCAEEWLDLAVRAGGIGAWRWDVRGDPATGLGAFDITRNDRYNQIMDIDPPSPWTSEMLFRIIHPDDVQNVRERIDALASGRADIYEALYRIHRRDGSLRWIQAQGRSVRDGEGNVIRLTGSVRDVTDQVKLEAERDQFVATLSHDLRNPLAAARANAELLLRYWPRVGSQDRLLNKIVVNVDRVERMVRDLLDTSRMDAGHPLELQTSPCDLAVVAFEAIEDLSALYGDRFRLDAEGQFFGTWACDAFRRVVENLATNAVKYGDPVAPVRLRLSRTPQTVVLAVHNEGNPIPPDEQKTMFQPFRRTTATQPGGPRGWGLGLTLVRGIADALGGRVHLDSDPERGTTFRFELPIPQGAPAPA